MTSYWYELQEFGLVFLGPVAAVIAGGALALVLLLSLIRVVRAAFWVILELVSPWSGNFKGGGGLFK